MKFSVGDYIIYGETGVCFVEEIVIKEMADGEKECYKLKPINQGFMIYTPTESGNVFMRAVITKSEADELIASLASIEPIVCKSTSPRELTDKYDKIIKTHDCVELLRLIKSIYEKKKLNADKRKKLSAIDERFLKKSEELLFSELAVALGSEKSEVRAHIESAIG